MFFAYFLLRFNRFTFIIYISKTGVSIFQFSTFLMLLSVLIVSLRHILCPGFLHSFFASKLFHAFPFSKLATYMILMCMEWLKLIPFSIEYEPGYYCTPGKSAPRFSRRAKHTVDSSSMKWKVWGSSKEK